MIENPESSNPCRGYWIPGSPAFRLGAPVIVFGGLQVPVTSFHNNRASRP